MNALRFGLIGYPLKNSFSVNYMNARFQEAGLPWQYENLEVADVSQLDQLFNSNSIWSGFNITRPHKKNIFPYLSSLSEAARLCGAVNCVVKEKNGEWTGHNTDVTGFSRSLQGFIGSNRNRKALILGTGGAAMAAAGALTLLQIPYTFCGRNTTGMPQVLSFEDLSNTIVHEHTLIIQCTPVGMFPEEDAVLPFPFKALGKEHDVYDMIYLPAETSFMKQALAQGARAMNGLEMLHFQANDAFEIWTDALT